MICKHGMNAHKYDHTQWLICYAEKKAHERAVVRLVLWSAIGISIVILILMLVHAWLFYGDPTCAFAECRKVITP